MILELIQNMCAKKKVLFVIPSFLHGGTIKSLSNLLPKLNEEVHEVDVYAITPEGYYYNEIKENANILTSNGKSYRKESDGLISVKNYSNTLFTLMKGTKKILERIGVDISSIIFKRVARNLNKNYYDTVIAFQEGQATCFVSYLSCSKKIAWVRCDYANRLSYLKRYDLKYDERLYKNFHKIICVSNYTATVFSDLFPSVKDKVETIHNVISDEKIITKSKLEGESLKLFGEDCFNILSIGRIDLPKRFSIIPEIASSLAEKRMSFKWYIIGDVRNQDEYGLLINNILKYKMENYIVLLGEINNPYPYIAHTDLLVCTSSSEACPNVINEAKILHTPIVSTDFGSVYEYIEDGVTGLIATVDNIAEKIMLMIVNDHCYQKIRDEIGRFTYDNSEILKKVEEIL